MQIPRLRGAPRVALPRLEQESERLIELLVVVGDRAADEGRHRQPRIDRRGELGLAERLVVALARDLDERERLMRLRRRARQRQLGVRARLVRTIQREQHARGAERAVGLVGLQL